MIVKVCKIVIVLLSYVLCTREFENNKMDSNLHRQTLAIIKDLSYIILIKKHPKECKKSLNVSIELKFLSCWSQNHENVMVANVRRFKNK